MKTILAFFVLMSFNAQASQVECTESIREFNKKFSSKAEFVFLDHGESGTPLFLRTKIGAPKPESQQAEGMKTVRICIKAGFSNSIYLGDIGNDVPKSFCQVMNLNTMSASCNTYEGKTKFPVIKLK